MHKELWVQDCVKDNGEQQDNRHGDAIIINHWVMISPWITVNWLNIWSNRLVAQSSNSSLITTYLIISYSFVHLQVKNYTE